MKEFFNNFLIAFRSLGNASNHQKIMFYGSFVVYMLLGIIFGFLSSVIFTALLGLIYELTFCYVPPKEIEIFGKTVIVPDYIRFKNEFTFLDTKTYHKFDMNNIYFCIDGILIGVIIRLIFVLL